MPLSIHLSIHLAFALLAGYIAYTYYHNFYYSFIAGIIGGFFIDLDHLVEYLIVFGLNFDLQTFFSGIYFEQSGKLHIFFHGWEYVLIGLLIFYFLKNQKLKALFLALSLGMFFHLTADVFLNHLSVPTYSILYRYSMDFDLRELSD
jgi:hypothetical protein